MEHPQEGIVRKLLNEEKEDLDSLCATNREYLAVCSGPYFWRRRFASEGLPLLMEGHDYKSWGLIYNRALKAMEYADDFLSRVGRGIVGEVSPRTDTGEPGNHISLAAFDLWHVKDPKMLYVGRHSPAKIDEYLVESYKIESLSGAIRETEDARKEITRLQGEEENPRWSLYMREVVIPGRIGRASRRIEELGDYVSGGPGKAYCVLSRGYGDRAGSFTLYLRLIPPGSSRKTYSIDLVDRDEIRRLVYSLYFFGTRLHEL